VAQLNVLVTSADVLEKIRFSELVRNSYDAYSKEQLKKGSHLEIKIVISTSDDLEYTVIKVKDNASGFAGQVRSAHFDKEEVQKEEKNSYDYNGGLGLGISEFMNSVKKFNGSVSFKNRKEAGAVVYIKVKKNASLQSSQVPAPLTITLRHEDFRKPSNNNSTSSVSSGLGSTLCSLFTCCSTASQYQEIGGENVEPTNQNESCLQCDR